MRTNRRRNYLINKKYQGVFIASFILTSLAGIALTLAVMHHLIQDRIEVYIYRSHIGVTGTEEIVMPVALKVGVVFFVLGVLVIGALSYYYSSKAMRLVRGLKEGLGTLRGGRLDFRMDIGHRREFPNLEAALNLAISRNAARVNVLKDAASGLDEAARELACAGTDPAKCAEAAKRLKEKAAGVRSALSAFRLKR